jgi:hypothetical protein
VCLSLGSGAFQEMMRDAEELPVILTELEDAWAIVERGLYVIVSLSWPAFGLDLV